MTALILPLRSPHSSAPQIDAWPVTDLFVDTDGSEFHTLIDDHDDATGARYQATLCLASPEAHEAGYAHQISIAELNTGNDVVLGLEKARQLRDALNYAVNAIERMTGAHV